jgi:hypothetical protein
MIGKKRPIRLSHLKTDDPHMRRVMDRNFDILNGGVNHGGIQPSAPGVSPAFSPGTTSVKGNTDSVHAKAVFAVTDVDVAVIHNLNRLPTGYRVASCNNPAQIYNGSVAPTLTTITLRAHLVGAAATVVLEVY